LAASRRRPGDPERPGEAAVSRRKLLLGAGALSVGAAAVTAAIVWRAGSDATATPELTSVRETTAPPPDQPRQLAAALRAALAVTPMADFAHEGGLSQSDFTASAKGSLVHDPLATDGSGSVDLTMTVTTPASADDQVVVIGAGEREGVYLNGREAKGKDETGVVLHARLIALVASVGVVTELVALTPGLSGSDRVHAGSLVTTTAPQPLQDILAEIAGGWSRRELEKSTLDWKLTLDERSRPRDFELVWRAPIQEDVLTSSWTTGYSGWRTGSISAPQ
jgi:hypothetical protein